MPSSLCYYQILNISKTASQQQIKQSYKKLALKYHPDKNEDKQMAKLKFHQLSQAYTVLNDVKKRQKYDKYGVRQSQFNDLAQYEQMMTNDFQFFNQFIDQILSFDQMDNKMLNQLFKSNGGKKNKKKKGGRIKNKSNNIKGLESVFNLNDMNSMLQSMMMGEMMGEMMGGMMGGMEDMLQGMNQQQLNQLLKDPEFRSLMQQQGLSKKQLIQMMNLSNKKNNKNKNKNKQLQQQIQSVSQSDDQQLTQQQLLYLQFGNSNIQKKKNKKKKKIIKCKFDQQKIQQDQIMIHFMQNHQQQFTTWIKNGKKMFQFKNPQENNTKLIGQE